MDAGAQLALFLFGSGPQPTRRAAHIHGESCPAPPQPNLGTLSQARQESVSSVTLGLEQLTMY